MAKTLVLAEKPSVARELARVLGCKQSGEGYLEGEKYIVTWALGHLVELAPPEDYDKAWAKWDMLTLPMLPERMKTVVIPQSGRQFRAVQAQLRRGDVGELVIATRETADADDPVEVYNNRYLHRVDMTYPLDASDFGPDDYRVYLADTDNLRGSELRAALIGRLYSAGVRVLGVPDGAAAGMLLDDYLQTGNAASLSCYLTALPAAERDSARALWQQVRASHPGALHAVGLGADARRATVARALSVLADNSSKAPEEEIEQAVQAMRSGTPADAVYWFKAAMAKYPRQMERFLGEEYAKATRLYYALQGTLNISSPEELPLYDAKQLLRSYPEDGILLFTDESSAMQQEGSMAAALQAELDDQPREEDEEPGRVCSIAAVYGTWSNAGSFTPDETETAWDADSLTEYLGSDALRGKDMLLALDGEDSPYLRKRCLLKDTDAPVGEQVQKLFVLDKNNMASPETADAE